MSADFSLAWCAAPSDPETDWVPAWEAYVAALSAADLFSIAVIDSPNCDDDEGHLSLNFEEFRQRILDAGLTLLRRGRNLHREVLWVPEGLEGGRAVFVACDMSRGDAPGAGFDIVGLVASAHDHRQLPWVAASDSM